MSVGANNHSPLVINGNADDAGRRRANKAGVG